MTRMIERISPMEYKFNITNLTNLATACAISIFFNSKVFRSAKVRGLVPLSWKLPTTECLMNGCYPWTGVEIYHFPLISLNDY